MPVSVVIPSFNRRELVRGAVASVCAQRGVECEIIVVDDGSTDGTTNALRAEFSTRVHVIRIENRGVSAARNIGVASSRGELIAFLDSDDLWLPDKLRAQVSFFRAHPDAQICQTGEIWIRNGVRVNPCAHHRKPSGDIFAPSLRLCLVSPSAVMLRRELWERSGGFDEQLPVCEDYDLWLRIARDTPVWLIEQPLVVKRGGHSDQLSRRFWGMDRFRVAALARLLERGELTCAQRAATLQVLAEKCGILATGAARRGREAEAEAYRDLPRRFFLASARLDKDPEPSCPHAANTNQQSAKGSSTPGTGRRIDSRLRARSRPAPTDRIWGGEPAQAGLVPFVAAVSTVGEGGSPGDLRPEPDWPGLVVGRGSRPAATPGKWSPQRD